MRNPDPYVKRYTSLAWAAILGHEETFEFLLSSGHDDHEYSKVRTLPHPTVASAYALFFVILRHEGLREQHNTPPACRGSSATFLSAF